MYSFVCFWVGGWVRLWEGRGDRGGSNELLWGVGGWVEENEAVRMRCCGLWDGGWVGGWGEGVLPFGVVQYMGE